MNRIGPPRRCDSLNPGDSLLYPSLHRATATLFDTAGSSTRNARLPRKCRAGGGAVAREPDTDAGTDATDVSRGGRAVAGEPDTDAGTDATDVSCRDPWHPLLSVSCSHPKPLTSPCSAARGSEGARHGCGYGCHGCVAPRSVASVVIRVVLTPQPLTSPSSAAQQQREPDTDAGTDATDAPRRDPWHPLLSVSCSHPNPSLPLARRATHTTRATTSSATAAVVKL
jgi:hypothetical protein